MYSYWLICTLYYNDVASAKRLHRHREQWPHTHTCPRTKQTFLRWTSLSCQRYGFITPLSHPLLQIRFFFLYLQPYFFMFFAVSFSKSFTHIFFSPSSFFVLGAVIVIAFVACRHRCFFTFLVCCPIRRPPIMYKYRAIRDSRTWWMAKWLTDKSLMRVLSRPKASTQKCLTYVMSSTKCLTNASRIFPCEISPGKITHGTFFRSVQPLKRRMCSNKCFTGIFAPFIHRKILFIFIPREQYLSKLEQRISFNLAIY